MFDFVKKKYSRIFIKNTNIKDTVTTKDALDYIYTVFRYCGIIIPKDNKWAFVIWGIIIQGFSTVLLPVTFFASYFVNTDKEMDYGTLFTSIQVFFNVISNSAKQIVLIFMVPQLLTAEDVMVKLDERCVAKDEVELLYKLKKFGRKIGIYFTVCYMTFSTSTFVCSFISGHPPYAIYVPRIDWRNSTWEFVVASFVEWSLMNGACYQQVGNDSYGPIYVNILRAHLNILCLRMKKLGSNPEKTLDENYEELKRCIKDHKNIIKLYDIITPVIETTIFIQFTITAATLGTTLINILIFAPNFSAIIASVSYILAVNVQIFPLCYFCNCLLLNNEDLEDEIFHSSWMNQNKSYRKMLVFFLHRAQSPMIMTAGKIYPINLTSYISIAKFSFSLYTFINTMDIKGKLGME